MLKYSMHKTLLLVREGTEAVPCTAAVADLHARQVQGDHVLATDFGP